MKKIIVLFLFIGNTCFAQDQSGAQINRFQLKQDQLTLDVELLSIGLTGTHLISGRAGVGLGFQLGYGMKYILNNPNINYCGSECGSGDCCSVQKLASAYDLHAEFAKIKLFYRYHFTPVTYLNAGIFGSLGTMPGGERPTTNTMAGFQFDFFTGLKKFKIGLKTQLGKSYLSYSSANKSNFILISFTPALQVYF